MLWLVVLLKQFSAGFVKSVSENRFLQEPGRVPLMCVCERERQRETERDRERQRETETQRESDAWTE